MPSGGILLVGVGLGQHCSWPLNADPLGGSTLKHADQSVGPVFSHSGLRTWDLWLTPHGIVAVRHSFWRTVRLSAPQLLRPPNDPVQFRESNPLDVFFPIHWVERLVLGRKRVLISELHIHTRDGQNAKYGLLDTSDILRFGDSLRRAYPDLLITNHPKQTAAA